MIDQAALEEEIAALEKLRALTLKKLDRPGGVYDAPDVTRTIENLDGAIAILKGERRH